MGPMIDAELESVDRRHAQLTRLSTELVDALNLYHQLMHENMSAAAYGMPPQPPSMGKHDKLEIFFNIRDYYEFNFGKVLML